MMLKIDHTLRIGWTVASDTSASWCLVGLSHWPVAEMGWWGEERAGPRGWREGPRLEEDEGAGGVLFPAGATRLSLSVLSDLPWGVLMSGRASRLLLMTTPAAPFMHLSLQTCASICRIAFYSVVDTVKTMCLICNRHPQIGLPKGIFEVLSLSVLALGLHLVRSSLCLSIKF